MLWKRSKWAGVTVWAPTHVTTGEEKGPVHVAASQIDCGTSTSKPEAGLTIHVRLVELKLGLPNHQWFDGLHVLSHGQPKFINIPSVADSSILPVKA
jgi:hypothetical protein